MSATIFANVSVPHGHGGQLEGEAAPARACAQRTLQICVKFHLSIQPDFHLAVSERGVTIRDGCVPLCIKHLVSGAGDPSVPCREGSNRNGQDGACN